MESIFYQTCYFKGDLKSKWDVLKVTSMQDMFDEYLQQWVVRVERGQSDQHDIYGTRAKSSTCKPCPAKRVPSTRTCTSGIRIYPTGTFVKSRTWIICSSHVKSFNQDLVKWNVGKVVNMQTMCRQASAFNQDVHQWYQDLPDWYSTFTKSPTWIICSVMSNLSTRTWSSGMWSKSSTCKPCSIKRVSELISFSEHTSTENTSTSTVTSLISLS